MEVNQFFADKAMEAIDRLLVQDKDVLPLVWVHDYHLTLVASIIRKVSGSVYWPNEIVSTFIGAECCVVCASIESGRARHPNQIGILSAHPVSSLGHLPTTSLG